MVRCDYVVTLSQASHHTYIIALPAAAASAAALSVDKLSSAVVSLIDSSISFNDAVSQASARRHGDVVIASGDSRRRTLELAHERNGDWSHTR